MLIVPHPEKASDRHLDFCVARHVWCGNRTKVRKSKLKMRRDRAYSFSSNVMVHKEKDFLTLPYLKFNSGNGIADFKQADS